MPSRIFRPAALSLALILCLLTARAQPYRNLALEGGGIRGIAYAGAIQELEARQVMDSIRNVAGTSVGALAGTMVAMGYTSAALKDVLFHLNIRTFNDGRWFFLGGQQRLRRQFGWYPGDALERWTGRQIAAQTGKADLTFGELHQLALRDHRFKDLYITATNLSLQTPVVFSWQSHPDMAIKTAVRASMSIPLYFRAVLLDSNGHPPVKGSTARYDLYVDGGILMNYPLQVFDSGGIPNRETLGLKLERRSQIPYFLQSDGIAPYDIRTFNTYVAALYNIIIEGLNRKNPMKDEAFRTIYISTEDVNPRVRHVSIVLKQLLYDSGLRAARRFPRFATEGQNRTIR